MCINLALRVWNRILLGLTNQIKTESRNCGRKWGHEILFNSGSCNCVIPQHTKSIVTVFDWCDVFVYKMFSGSVHFAATALMLFRQGNPLGDQWMMKRNKPLIEQFVWKTKSFFHNIQWSICIQSMKIARRVESNPINLRNTLFMESSMVPLQSHVKEFLLGL